MAKASDALADGGPSASRRLEEERRGTDGTEGPGGARDEGSMGRDTCHRVIDPV
jgi:hypothetical protein